MAKVDVTFAGTKRKNKNTMGSILVGQVKNVNYDIKQQAYAVYAEARNTMAPEHALQAVRIFILTRFFGTMEVMSHSEDVPDAQIRELMQKRILDFAKILDLDEKRFEEVRMTKRCNQQRKKGNRLAENVFIALNK
jgi:hypothetical protein